MMAPLVGYGLTRIHYGLRYGLTTLWSYTLSSRLTVKLRMEGICDMMCWKVFCLLPIICRTVL